MPRHPRSLLATLVVGVLVVAGCSSADDDTSAAVDVGPAMIDWQKASPADIAEGGTVRLAAESLPTSFNPYREAATSASAAKILSPTSGHAVTITNKGSWIVNPDYATSVEIAEESPLTIDVALNPAAVWQGGAPITADDMVAYWEAQNGSDSDFEVASTAGWDAITSIDQGDDEFHYTVTFDQARADWPLYVYPRLPASVSSSAKKFNDGFTKAAPPSNGPFLVKKIKAKTGTITLVRNPRWWGTPAHLKSVVWRIATPQIQAEAYVSDELDAVQLDPSTYDIAKDTGTVRRVMGLEWSQLTLNAGRGPLRDAKVRRAVRLAIDRQAIADDVAAEFDAPGVVMDSVIYVPGHRFHSGSSQVRRNVAEARALLDEAGYTENADGQFERKGKALTLTLPVPSGTTANAARAQLIADQLAEAGMNVKLDNVPAAKFFNARVVPLDFDVVTFTWRSAPFISETTKARFYPLDSPQNFTGQGSDAVAEAFDEAIGTVSGDDAKSRAAAADEAVLKADPLVPLAVAPLVMATRDGLVNYGPATFRTLDWTKVGFLAE